MIYSPKEKHDIISGLANIFLVLGAILLVIHLLAPLLGGKLLINALVIYGSWIGFALCMKYEARRIKRKEKMNARTHLPIVAYGMFCMAIWISYPYNLVAMLFYLLANLFAFKTEQQRHNKLKGENA
ncbi:MAG: hypothetical protein WC633_01240 [Desulfurivibrionaceae bacterium]|jgi:cobalamin synthase